MSNAMKRISMSSLLGLTLALAAYAGNQASLTDILEQQRELETQIAAGELQGLTPRQINNIRRAQKEVFASTEGKTTLDELDINQKVRLENALERINAEVKGGRVAGEEQDVCWRERKSGSKLKVTRCGTQAERDQARQGAREWMEKPKVCAPPGCGS
jgi:hypothetical protein